MKEARSCKTPEDLLALAKREGVELSDEQLEGIAGGDSWMYCDEDECADYSPHRRKRH